MATSPTEQRGQELHLARTPAGLTDAASLRQASRLPPPMRGERPDSTSATSTDGDREGRRLCPPPTICSDLDSRRGHSPAGDLSGRP